MGGSFNVGGGWGEDIWVAVLVCEGEDIWVAVLMLEGGGVRIFGWQF